MVDTIVCEVGTIICDIGTINVRFYLLKVQYPHRIHQKREEKIKIKREIFSSIGQTGGNPSSLTFYSVRVQIK